MRPLLSILSFLISVSCWAQPKLGMLTSYTLNPVSATSSSMGVAYTGTVSVNCYVKNKGNALFADVLRLDRQVTSTAFQSAVRTVYTASPSINPNDSVLITFTDSILPPAYKSNGNGNTIVVWPVSASAATVDSMRTVPVYVNDPSGIEELDRHPLMIYPNPVSRKLYFKPQEGRQYRQIVVYDLQMKELRRLPFEDGMDLGFLENGFYIITVSDHEGRIYSSRITKTD